MQQSRSLGFRQKGESPFGAALSSFHRDQVVMLRKSIKNVVFLLKRVKYCVYKHDGNV